jgi:pimeloyl-ACP methyl ester carboxylesterase
MRLTAWLLALVPAAIFSSSSVHAQTAADAAQKETRQAGCASLGRSDFSALPEAPTQILGAREVEAKNALPAFCEVSGVVVPNVGFRLELPLSGWNGKFFLAGCGNYCGILNTPACEAPLRRGYACIVTDRGHTQRSDDVARTDGEWAYDNLAAELDYGGRASHVTAVAGKALTVAFYGKPLSKSYFMGCSYGGHQALVLAQRFPWDFDGIVGGGAPMSISGLMQQNAWAMTRLHDADGHSVFSEMDIKVLHNWVLARCDLDDGVEDGLVSNPAACRVNVDALACRPGGPAECLSAAAVAAAKKAYARPSISTGEPITPGGWAPGSELHWHEVYRTDGVGLVALAPIIFATWGASRPSGRRGP